MLERKNLFTSNKDFRNCLEECPAGAESLVSPQANFSAVENLPAGRQGKFCRWSKIILVLKGNCENPSYSMEAHERGKNF